MNTGRETDAAERLPNVDRLLARRAMKMQHANVNRIRIAYGVRGSGPPLVLIMGYRLSSLAWPLDFIKALAKRFTVVLFDNRGTGSSEKPTFGYEISNMCFHKSTATHLRPSSWNRERVVYSRWIAST